MTASHILRPETKKGELLHSELDSSVWPVLKEVQSKVREDPGQGGQDSDLQTEVLTERDSDLDRVRHRQTWGHVVPQSANDPI